ncbi:MAG: c-type cytochrome [Acidimicrobiales bacterium]|nr:c-type cytochrome [Acidimicrobiales bacterium]
MRLATRFRSSYLVPVAVCAFVVSSGLTYFFAAPSPASASGSGAATAAAAGTKGPQASPTVLAEGKTLFDGSCSSCHGANAQGSSRAPNLIGVGAATVYFWVSTGRMPLAYPTAQAEPKTPSFNDAQSRAIAAYVASLGPGGPPIPTVDLQNANLSVGQQLFATNCAACHTITGVGDALSNGLKAPSLYPATPTQIAAAMRTGPGNMPRFGPHNLSDQEVNDIVAYAKYLRQPTDRGGFGLGHIGPIAEGFVALVIGVGSLLFVSWWIAGKLR